MSGDAISKALMGVPYEKRCEVQESLIRRLWPMVVGLRRENKRLKAIIRKQQQPRPLTKQEVAEAKFRKVMGQG